MLVRELIEKLQKMDGSRLVVLSRDAEGNGYSCLANFDDNSTFKPDRPGSGRGDTGLERLTTELLEQGYTTEDVLDGVPCVTLWPV